MNDRTDSQLLRAYAEQRSEAAFAELVRRHVDFVYSAARRMVCDAHLAQDVTQGVFVALAKNPGPLIDRPVLSGWLHRTAQNIAAQTVRTDVRRRAREQEAAAMNELFVTEPDGVWERISPHLDAALGELSEADHDALLLRYFERKSAQEMAQVLGISDDAAQKRVSRAVERLREFLAKRGVTVGASGLVVVISTNAVLMAPTGLSAAITVVAIAGTTIAATAIAMTTFQKTLITAVVAAAVGIGIYENRQASALRNQMAGLQQQQTALTERLTRERDDAANQMAALRDENAGLKLNSAELPKLRGQLDALRRENNDLRINGAANAPENPEAIYTAIGATTPDAGLRRFVAAAKLGDGTNARKFISWQRGDNLTQEELDAILRGPNPLGAGDGLSMHYGKLVSIRIVQEQMENDHAARARVERLNENGTNFAELRFFREADEWKPVIRFVRTSSGETEGSLFLALTPGLGPTNGLQYTGIWGAE